MKRQNRFLAFLLAALLIILLIVGYNFFSDYSEKKKHQLPPQPYFVGKSSDEKYPVFDSCGTKDNVPIEWSVDYEKSLFLPKTINFNLQVEGKPDLIIKNDDENLTIEQGQGKTLLYTYSYPISGNVNPNELLDLSINSFVGKLKSKSSRGKLFTFEFDKNILKKVYSEKPDYEQKDSVVIKWEVGNVKDYATSSIYFTLYLITANGMSITNTVNSIPYEPVNGVITYSFEPGDVNSGEYIAKVVAYYSNEICPPEYYDYKLNSDQFSVLCNGNSDCSEYPCGGTTSPMCNVERRCECS